MKRADVADILNEELKRRCGQNQLYSMRAMARTLQISPANLSLILSRKRKPSLKTIQRIFSKLHLEPLQKEWVTQSFSVEPEEIKNNFEIKKLDHVAHWACYAILSLMKTKNFESKYHWVAKRLGISLHEVKFCIKALEMAGFLDTSSKIWKRCVEGIRVQNKISTEVSRKFQHQLITKSLYSMENDPSHLRSISSITFAMSPEQVLAAQDEIRKFRIKMAEIFETPGQSTEVYNLTIQLTPATIINKEVKK